MDAGKQEILEQKKKQLQLKLGVRNFIKMFLTEWLPVYQTLTEKNIPFNMQYLACVTAEEIPFWETELNEGDLKPFGFDTSQLLISETCPVRRQIDQVYPSVNPLRYVPDFDDSAIYGESWLNHLLRAQADTGIANDTPVYFLYMRFAPVLQLTFGDVMALHDDPIWQTECMVICATDMSSIICRTLEDSWHWGKTPAPAK